MAKTKGPLFSLDASGPFGRLLTFGRSKQGVTGRRKNGPRGIATELQVARREAYRAAVDAWNELNTEEKAVFAAGAAALRMSGYNLFIREYLATPIPTDEYFAYVKLLAHFDIDAADVLGHTATLSNASVSAAQSVFGGKSLAITGASGYASYNFPVGTELQLSGDFTIEFFLWLHTNINEAAWLNSEVSGGFQIGHRSGATWGLAKSFTAWVAYASALPSLDTWHHVAVTRAGTAVKVFLDGAVVGTGTSSATFLSASSCRIGGASWGSSINGGYVDEVRITNGIARYTAAFTPPDAPFPDQGP